jgi:hypothetical protein
MAKVNDQRFDEALSASTARPNRNLSALRDDQRAEIRDGRVLFCFEAYRNITAQRNADFESYVRNTGPYAGLGSTAWRRMQAPPKTPSTRRSSGTSTTGTSKRAATRSTPKECSRRTGRRC